MTFCTSPKSNWKVRLQVPSFHILDSQKASHCTRTLSSCDNPNSAKILERILHIDLTGSLGNAEHCAVSFSIWRPFALTSVLND